MSKEMVRIVNAERVEDLISVFGSFDENIRKIEEELSVAIINRGNELRISGDEENTDKAARTLEGLLSLASKGEVIDEQRVRYLITLVKEGNDAQVAQMAKDVVCITAKGKPIKAKTVGDGQHGTARWATTEEIKKTFHHVRFQVEKWRKGEERPTEQGLVLGSIKKKGKITALVDADDIHCLMIGASGVGKTAFFLYPNMEYAFASGMSGLYLDTKGDLARNYGTIAKKYYGYENIAVIDLRNPTRSDSYNLLTLINRYMDICRADSENIAARAKAEKYAKILSKTIICQDGDTSSYGQNAYFYEAAQGVLTAVILLLAEYLPPTDDHPEERRHIVSVFKLVQELLTSAPGSRGKTLFQVVCKNQLLHISSDFFLLLFSFLEILCYFVNCYGNCLKYFINSCACLV